MNYTDLLARALGNVPIVDVSRPGETFEAFTKRMQTKEEHEHGNTITNSSSRNTKG